MSEEKPTAVLRSWHQVVITSNDAALAQNLMNRFVQLYREAGRPDDAEVFHPRNEELDHVYYFSPAASAIGAELLQEFSATACERPKNFEIPAFKVTL